MDPDLAEVAELADAADSKRAQPGGDHETSGNVAGQGDDGKRPETVPGQSAGNHPDLLELALSVAVEQRDASAIAKVMDEMRARREAAAGVLSLDAERARRGGKG